MAGYWTDIFSFVTATIRNRDCTYIVLSDDAAAEQKIPMSSIISYKPDGWGDGGQTTWRTAGVSVVRQPLEQLIVVGEYGTALLVGGGDRHEEAIVTSDSSPAKRGPLRGVRSVENQILVVGMNRQVYRRVGHDSWENFDTDIPRNSASEIVSGFEAVDGFSMSEIYAVGWDGEIWCCENETWAAQASPANSVLVDVCCGGDGFVYACGRNGLLIKGKKGQWDIVDQGAFSEDLWNLAWYKNRLYASSMDNVFVLEDGELSPVYMGDDQAKTCYRLCTGDGIMLSIGAKDIMSFDGASWTRID
jgi:hypothetical protein